MVVVAAGPMGSSGAGAPGCGHPSGWPAARGRGAWGWSARAAGSIRSTATPPGAGARQGAITRCPRPGLLTLASCSAGTGGQGPDVPVAHCVKDAGEQLAGRGDLGDVACLDAAAGDDGVLELAYRGAGRGALDRLDHRPAQHPRALLICAPGLRQSVADVGLRLAVIGAGARSVAYVFPGPGCCLVLDGTARVRGRPKAGRAATRSAFEPGRAHPASSGGGDRGRAAITWRVLRSRADPAGPAGKAPRLILVRGGRSCRRRHDGDRVPPGPRVRLLNLGRLSGHAARQAAGLREPAAGHQLSGRRRGSAGMAVRRPAARRPRPGPAACDSSGGRACGPPTAARAGRRSGPGRRQK